MAYPGFRKSFSLIILLGSILVLPRGSFVGQVEQVNRQDSSQCALELDPNISDDVSRSYVCITYNDINKAFEKAAWKLAIDFKQRRVSADTRRDEPVKSQLIRTSHENIDLSRRSLSNWNIALGYTDIRFSGPHTPKAISRTAEVVLETTNIIKSLFNLSAENIENDLPRIDTLHTNIAEHCPPDLKPLVCSSDDRYRFMDGRCNNLFHPHWGAAQTPFVRLLSRRYADGLMSPRVSNDGSPLPSARIISNIIHSDRKQSDKSFTNMFMVWGQLIAHDVTFVAQTLDSKFAEELCCNVTKSRRHKNCLPINVGPRDQFYSRFGQRCIEFIRSLAAQRVGCTLGPRDQLNQLTSFIDADFVYGSSKSAAKNLRLFRSGLLKCNTTLKHKMNLKELLPARTDVPTQGCFYDTNRDSFCFEAGDKRLNENILLTTLHTLWMREHNRIATVLQELNPEWDDENLYQEARHIVAALVQHITYNEYLPLLLGPSILDNYDLGLQSEDFYYDYDPKINAGITSVFMTSAFRFGHSQIPSIVKRFNNHHELISSVRLNFLIQQPYDLYKPGYIDQYVLGMVNQPTESSDEAMAEEMTNHLFQHPGTQHGLDLAAINIQRGRDHGVPGYNEWRQFCGFKKANFIDDFKDFLPRGIVEKYKKLYKHPDDVDLWSAGISEIHLPGAIVGPTFTCLLGIQFHNLRKGDRFWYENHGWPSSFTKEQLKEIRRITLSRILCDNTDNIETIQMLVMKLPNGNNGRKNCEDIASMDLSKWKA